MASLQIADKKLSKHTATKRRMYLNTQLYTNMKAHTHTHMHEELCAHKYTHKYELGTEDRSSRLSGNTCGQSFLCAFILYCERTRSCMRFLAFRYLFGLFDNFLFEISIFLIIFGVSEAISAIYIFIISCNQIYYFYLCVIWETFGNSIWRCPNRFIFAPHSPWYRYVYWISQERNIVANSRVKRWLPWLQLLKTLADFNRRSSIVRALTCSFGNSLLLNQFAVSLSLWHPNSHFQWKYFWLKKNSEYFVRKCSKRWFIRVQKFITLQNQNMLRSSNRNGSSIENPSK